MTGIPAKIISFPFRRAIYTAEPLANRLRLPIYIAALYEFTYLSPDRCRDTTPQERQLCHGQFIQMVGWLRRRPSDLPEDLEGRVGPALLPGSVAAIVKRRAQLARWGV